jgi:hypothetical protein
LFNIGQTKVGLKDYAGAVDAFERYLAEGGTEVPAICARARAIEKLIRMRPIQVGRTVRARVTVDDIAIEWPRWKTSASAGGRSPRRARV